LLDCALLDQSSELLLADDVYYVYQKTYDNMQMYGIQPIVVPHIYTVCVGCYAFSCARGRYKVYVNLLQMKV